MLPCPLCRSRLSRVKTPLGFIYKCTTCGGRSVAVPVLRKDSAGDFMKSLLVAAHQDGARPGRPCPFCAKPMKRFPVPTPGGPVELDYCRLCNQVWFDPKEYQAVPHSPPPDTEELSGPGLTG